MAEHYEIQAASGFLSVSCACESSYVLMSIKDIRKGWAGACGDGRCVTIAAHMNGVERGADSSEVAVPKMWRNIRVVSPRKGRNMPFSA